MSPCEVTVESHNGCGPVDAHLKVLSEKTWGHVPRHAAIECDGLGHESKAVMKHVTLVIAFGCHLPHSSQSGSRKFTRVTKPTYTTDRSTYVALHV